MLDVVVLGEKKRGWRAVRRRGYLSRDPGSPPEPPEGLFLVVAALQPPRGSCGAAAAAARREASGSPRIVRDGGGSADPARSRG